MIEFKLDSRLDPHDLAKIYRRTGRLQISKFLSCESAQALHDELAGSTAWRLTANRGEEIMDFGPEALAKFTPDHWGKLRKAAALGGRYGFQFLYDTIRLPKTRAELAATSTLLARLSEFLSSSETIAFLRTLTGDSDVTFADAHASRYLPGHFLTTHDDKMDDMGRRAAYVLNLSPNWRPDWGGLLLFYDGLGNVERGFTPGFNSLNIFAVPQPHSVSWVTPLAPAPRYAVTGWLRSGEPE
jgi:Rps23 Pro-64 3,4-dihydroxylase Tpa1-like proline 4-hydroxylase